MPKEFIIWHEPLGIVEEVGPDVTRVTKGDRVILPFNIACGQCYESQCEHANPHGDAGAYFGYSETFGGYAGGQAVSTSTICQFRTVFVPLKLPDDCEMMEDEKLLFLSDILPTAYWGVDNAGVNEGDTVIVLAAVS